MKNGQSLIEIETSRSEYEILSKRLIRIPKRTKRMMRT